MKTNNNKSRKNKSSKNVEKNGLSHQRIIKNCKVDRNLQNFKNLQLIKSHSNILCLVRLLLYWYRSQKLCIKWGSHFSEFFNRGGVEDTRLEAKAKDTKKIRGHCQSQGQRFRKQTLSRPRAGILEAKDQPHSCKCSQKERVFKKVFQAISNF